MRGRLLYCHNVAFNANATLLGDLGLLLPLLQGGRCMLVLGAEGGEAAARMGRGAAAQQPAGQLGGAVPAAALLRRARGTAGWRRC